MKLLALVGKKKAGKDTTADFIIRNEEILFPKYHNVSKVYFATPMKEFAHEFLGVERYKLWGTDAQKSEATHITWEMLPHFFRLVADRKITTDQMGEALTGRQLLQQIGEEMFLEMNPNIWLNRFEESLSDCGFDSFQGLAICPDARKPEQIATLKKFGGRLIKLLRNSRSDDTHVSETALDACSYEQSNFDAIIDNSDLSVAETNKRVLYFLRKFGFVTGQIDLAQIGWQ